MANVSRAAGVPRRRWHLGRRLSLALLVVLVGVGAYTIIVGLSALRHARAAQADLRRIAADVATAQAGTLDSQTLVSLRGNLLAAEGNLAALQRDLDRLGPAIWLGERLPRLGPRLRSDVALAHAAVSFVRAGRQFADVAVAVYAGLEQGSSQDRGALVAALAGGGPIIAGARTDYRRGLEHLAAVDRGQVEPQLRPALADLDRQLPQLDSLIEIGATLIPRLPALLGQDREATYLLLMQDPGELRPTGGFIGNYGLIKVRNGAIASVFFQDVYLVDLPYLAAQRPLPFPFDPYFPRATAWGLRDSNAWPDFPTSARAAIDLAVAEGVATEIDGVIAITPELVSRLLAVVGPVRVPEYNATVDLDGAMRVGQGDFLWAVETNIGANKADLYLARDLVYAVKLAADGSATSSLQLSFEFRPTGQLYDDFGYDYFRAYVAVYRPPGARLVTSSPALDTRIEGGARVDGQLLEVQANSHGRIALLYEQVGAAGALADGSYEYRLRLPRQAGGSWRTHTLTITLPPGAQPVSVPPGSWVVEQTVVLTTVPDADLEIAIVYRLP